MKKETDKKNVKKSETKKVESVKEKVTETKVSKKTNKKRSIGKWVNLAALLIGIVLVVVGLFVEGASEYLKVIGSVVIAVSGLAYAVRSNEHVLVKSVLVLTFVAILLTWLFPYGYFSGSVYTDYGMSRVGLNDLPTVIYYGIYFAMDKMMYLLALAGFYALLSRTSGYKKLVSDTAKALENHKMLFTIITGVIVLLLTAVLTNTLAVMFFIPFFISILAKLKVDKLTAFIVTFGAILVGMIGAPWGTEGLYWFNYYAGTTLEDGFTLRLIIEGIVLFAFVVLNILRLVKVNKTTEKLEPVKDLFEVGETPEKAKKYPMIIILSLMVIMVILGYTAWETNFGVTVFNTFHEWLTGLTIGEDFTIFAYILGSAAKIFGQWDIATFVTLILVSSVLISLVYRIKLSDFLTAYGDGFKRMAKPIAMFVSVFMIFVVFYTTPVIPTITNWMLNLTTEFNPFITSIMAFITSVFHADLGFTGYTVGGFLASAYVDQLSIAHTIYFALYGMVQLLIPSSGLLLLGLSYTKLEYKTWLKYVWKFALIMLAMLIIVFAVATYI